MEGREYGRERSRRGGREAVRVEGGRKGMEADGKKGKGRERTGKSAGVQEKGEKGAKKGIGHGGRGGRAGDKEVGNKKARKTTATRQGGRQGGRQGSKAGTGRRQEEGKEDTHDGHTVQ